MQLRDRQSLSLAVSHAQGVLVPSVVVPYSTGLKRHQCYSLAHPRLERDYVICAFTKSREDGIPRFTYQVFHWLSGSIVGMGESPEIAIEKALNLVGESDDESLTAYFAETLERKQTFERMAEEHVEKMVSRARAYKGKEREGAVYLIKSAGRYKIGKSVNPEQRIANMQLPERPEVIAIQWSDAYAEAEKELHLRFAHKRQHGEWFDFTEEELKEVEKALRAF